MGGRGGKTRCERTVSQKGHAQKKKPSAVAGKVSFCFGAQVGAEAQNVRGHFLTTRPIASGDHRLRATCRQVSDGPYFLDLVVLFFVDFLAPPFAADLLPIFFAMALYLLSCRTNLRGAKFAVNVFF